MSFHKGSVRYKFSVLVDDDCACRNLVFHDCTLNVSGIFHCKPDFLCFQVAVRRKLQVPTGAIIINKDGEFVTDTTLMKGHWYDFIFNYFKDSLAGVEFEVYAAEDIVSPDGLDTIYYEADELVATIVTDEKAVSSTVNRISSAFR